MNRIRKHLRLDGWRALIINMMIAAAYALEQTQSIVTFDKPPVSMGGAAISENYYESGFWVRREGGGLGARHMLERVGPNADGPDNGTTYLAFSRYYALKDSLVFSQVDNRSFGIVSVDVAEPNIASSLKPIFVTFNGIKVDGSSVTSTYALDGFIDGMFGKPDYQRFYFDTRFASDLVRLEIPSDVFALDNLAFTVAIPEPGAGLLLGVGALAAGGWRWFKREKAIRRVPAALTARAKQEGERNDKKRCLTLRESDSSIVSSGQAQAPTREKGRTGQRSPYRQPAP